MSNSYFYIANWKMYQTYNQAHDWLKSNRVSLAAIAQNKKIIICPSFESLAYAHDSLKNTSISLGAQDCSQHKTGAYTGQISAQSLAELGCTYCIVGHSEQRMYYTNDDIYQKIERLIENNITPIVCIRNSSENELAPIKKSLITHKKELLIAYEPVEAIGTGKIPSNDTLQETFTEIHENLKNLSSTKIYCIYGGSISEKNIHRLKEIPQIQGFLIGGASVDFESFKKIIE